MRQTVISQDIPYAQDRRLIKRLWKIEKSEQNQSGLEFSLQVLAMKNGKWFQVARIDNQLHEGKPGTHIHMGKKVVWKEIPFDQAEEVLLTISEKILGRGL